MGYDLTKCGRNELEAIYAKAQLLLEAVEEEWNVRDVEFNQYREGGTHE